MASGSSYDQPVFTGTTLTFEGNSGLVRGGKFGGISIGDVIIKSNSIISLPITKLTNSLDIEKNSSVTAAESLSAGTVELHCPDLDFPFLNLMGVSTIGNIKVVYDGVHRDDKGFFSGKTFEIVSGGDSDSLMRVSKFESTQEEFNEETSILEFSCNDKGSLTVSPKSSERPEIHISSEKHEIINEIRPSSEIFDASKPSSEAMNEKEQ